MGLLRLTIKNNQHLTCVKNLCLYLLLGGNFIVFSKTRVVLKSKHRDLRNYRLWVISIMSTISNGRAQLRHFAKIRIRSPKWSWKVVPLSGVYIRYGLGRNRFDFWSPHPRFRRNWRRTSVAWHRDQGNDLFPPQFFDLQIVHRQKLPGESYYFQSQSKYHCSMSPT